MSLGQRVREGELLGTVTDPITNVRSELRAPQEGRVLGMALNQVVMPGFAAFRLGIPTTESELASPEAAVPAEQAPVPAPEPPGEGDAAAAARRRELVGRSLTLQLAPDLLRDRERELVHVDAEVAVRLHGHGDLRVREVQQARAIARESIRRGPSARPSGVS